MPVGLSHRGNVAVVSPVGRLLNFGEVTLELQRVIRELVTAGNTKLVVNLREAELFGNQPLGLLIAARESYRKRGGGMRLCCLSKKDRNILQVTKLDLVFEIHATEDEAVASFEESATPGPPG